MISQKIYHPMSGAIYDNPYKSAFVARSIASGSFYDEKNLNAFVSNDKEAEGPNNILAK